MTRTKFRSPPAWFIAGVAGLALAAPIQAQAPNHNHEGGMAPPPAVPLYDNLGRHHLTVTTSQSGTQAYFDQGLRLMWAFNHAEATRAFAEAERRDPTCAMCAWGIAYSAGPNINAPMDSAANAAALAALARARAQSGRVTPAEQALIEALAERYGAGPISMQPRRDSAFAAAMGRVADRFPELDEAQVIRADALMNLSPWRYWTAAGQARPATPEMLQRLERVLQRNPNHPGACHLYIHAVEAQQPEKAVPCAEHLAALMPGAGHLVHMPGHIYIRVGRYQDAVTANQHAVHADESYLEGPAVERQGIYPQGYYPHNYHFMNFAASLSGQGEIAVMSARKVAEKVGPEVARQHPWLEALTPTVYATLVTFGRWQDILAEPLPPADLRYTFAMAQYARGMAFAATGKYDEAQAALAIVRATPRPEGDNGTALKIATFMLEGEIALRRGDASRAVRLFGQAAALEDGMTYTEPPVWYYPVRHSLGKALLAANKPAEAEKAYREDLKRFPDNGWALFGLEQSLRRQGKTAEADAVHQQFTQAWSAADVQLTASRF